MFLYACLVFGSASIALGQTSCMSAQVIGSYHCLSLIWYLYTGDLFVSTTYNWFFFCYYYNCVICITIHRKCHMGERGLNSTKNVSQIVRIWMRILTYWSCSTVFQDHFLTQNKACLPQSSMGGLASIMLGGNPCFLYNNARVSKTAWMKFAKKFIKNNLTRTFCVIKFNT